ncbi:hypothetical protein O6H91_10G104500 [Diphasiastrum complanatum]|uniref:Uncharacterized protein n=1 Tax=Diphasiastrum complanatum TaxID=34168 RepID=A0ACC2CK81_DIPCM|nr:hypothetical protein O6H91_10G104500 [Diphasiastrum complanatum]
MCTSTSTPIMQIDVSTVLKKNSDPMIVGQVKEQGFSMIENMSGKAPCPDCDQEVYVKQKHATGKQENPRGSHAELMDFNLQARLHENQSSSGLSPRGNSNFSYTQLIFNGKNDTNPPDECSCNMDGSLRGRPVHKADSLLGPEKKRVPHHLVLDPASKISRCNAEKTNFLDELAFRGTATSEQKDDKKSSTECSCNVDIGGNKGHASLRSELLSAKIPKGDSSNLFNLHAVTSNLKNCKNLKRSKSGSWSSSDAESKRCKHTVGKTYIINLITGACDEIRDAEATTVSNLAKAKQRLQTSFGTCSSESTKILGHGHHHALNSIMQLPILNSLPDGVGSNLYKKNDSFTGSPCCSSSSAAAAAANTPYEHCYGGWLSG